MSAQPAPKPPRTDLARIPEKVICRLGELSPAAGRLYLWFCARREHKTGVWRCSIPKAAAALAMETHTAYEARRELLGYRRVRSADKKKRWELVAPPWIALGPGDETRPLIGFEDEPVTLASAPAVASVVVAPATGCIAPAMPTVATATAPVAVATPAIDKDHTGDPTPHPPPTHRSHTISAATPVAPAARVCEIGENYGYAEVLRLGKNTGARNVHRFAMWALSLTDPEKRAGIRAQLDELVAEQVHLAGGPAPPQRDVSACPDCGGRGMWYPCGFDKGVAKCLHPRLASGAQALRPAEATA